jgi:5-oxopent-3-ene-1,2,5-tricarboxylate decarboxylase/2-hydroxyhepta-2,4-diene-1,7-dioate isomerase
MRWIRFAADGMVREGTWQDGRLVDHRGRAFTESEVVFLPPVTPQKIIGLALNYREHAGELGLEEPPEPVLFFKPPTALVGHRGSVIMPKEATFCHYEAELAVVIGRRCYQVDAAHALDYVKGYTIANDFTCRDYIRNTFRPPVRAKGYDTFLPLGPWLVTADEIADPGQLEVRTTVNGQLVQQGTTRQLIWSVPQIIAYIAAFITLEENDVLLTGTPPGLTAVHPGDVIACEIRGIGSLVNVVG